MAKAKQVLAPVKEMFFAFCKGIDTPRALKAWLLFKYEEWPQLAEFEVHPTEYNDAHSFADDYAVSSFLKKNKDLPKVVDTRAEAIRRFKLAESQCKETNQRFKLFEAGLLKIPDRVAHVLWRAREKTLQLASRFIPNADMCSWGNGATDDMSRPKAYIDLKLISLPISVTPRAARHGLGAIMDDLHWQSAIVEHNPKGGRLLAYTPGSVFDVVPKTVLTDRSIGKEPRLNGFLQKGAGQQLRRLLRTVGVDLNDQTNNQVLASLAIDLDLCTLDLSMASDCVAIEAVSFFLPIDVFCYLDEIRSTHTEIDGQWLKLEKFSSMGNGFTFELESLIFWGCVSAVSEESGRSVTGVYGDDLICHKDDAPLLTELLEFIGFSLNKKKSFTEGVFYESCGKHYFGGVDVTPVYQKNCPSNPEEALRMANRIFRYSARRARGNRLDTRFRPAWQAVVRSYDLARYAGPPLLEGDGHLEVPLSELKTPFCRNRGYLTRRRLVTVKAVPANASAMLALKLREMAQRMNDETPQEEGVLRGDDTALRNISYSDRKGWVNTAFLSTTLDW